MKFNYEGNSLKSGIYKIVNIHNGRIYIGSTGQFKDRWRNGHSCSLHNNRHSNKFLQADFNKCKAELGHDDFLEFHIVELMEGSTRETRKTTEQIWLDKYFGDTQICYNLQSKASLTRDGIPSKDPEVTRKKHSEASLGKLHSEIWNQKISESHKGKRLSAETKRKIGLASIGRGLGTKRDPSVGKKISEAKKGRPNPMSEDTRKKLLKHYNTNLLSPTGEIYLEVVGLREFAATHNLSCAGLKFLLIGQRKTHKGWTLLPSSIISE